MSKHTQNRFGGTIFEEKEKDWCTPEQQQKAKELKERRDKIEDEALTKFDEIFDTPRRLKRGNLYRTLTERQREHEHEENEKLDLLFGIHRK